MVTKVSFELNVYAHTQDKVHFPLFISFICLFKKAKSPLINTALTLHHVIVPDLATLQG